MQISFSRNVRAQIAHRIGRCRATASVARLAIALLCAVGLAFANDAHGTSISGRIGGTILWGIDQGGYFGGGDLSGQTITIDWQYDAPLVGSYFAAPSAEYYASFYNPGVGIFSATATIGGQSIDAGSVYGTNTTVAGTQTGATFTNIGYGPSGGPNRYFGLYTAGAWVAEDRPEGAPASYRLIGGGYQQLLSLSVGNAAFDAIAFQADAPASAIEPAPEPASLALLTVGVCALLTIRRRMRGHRSASLGICNTAPHLAYARPSSTLAGGRERVSAIDAVP